MLIYQLLTQNVFVVLLYFYGFFFTIWSKCLVVQHNTLLKNGTRYYTYCTCLKVNSLIRKQRFVVGSRKYQVVAFKFHICTSAAITLMPKVIKTHKAVFFLNRQNV